MKETTCVLVPGDEYWEMKEKAIKFDMLREEALRHPEHLTECVQALCGITDGQRSETDALMGRLDNLEGCGDNPVYAKEIREIRKRLDELSEREDFKVKFCENCYLRHRLMEEAEHEAE